MNKENHNTLPAYCEWEFLFKEKPLLLLANYSIEKGLVSPGVITSIFSSILQVAPHCFCAETAAEIKSYYSSIHQALGYQSLAEESLESEGLELLEMISYDEFESDAVTKLRDLLIDFDQFSQQSYSNEIIRFLLILGCEFDPMAYFAIQALKPDLIEQILLPKLGQSSRNLLYYWVFHPESRRQDLEIEHLAYLFNHSGVKWLTNLSPTDMLRISNQVKTFVSNWQNDPFYDTLLKLLSLKSGLEDEDGQASLKNQVELAGFPIQSKYPDSRPVVLSTPNYQGATHLEDLPIIETKDLELEVRLFESVDGDKLLCIELYSCSEDFKLIKFKPLQSSVTFLTDYDVPVAWINFDEDRPVYIDIEYKIGTFTKVEMLMINLEE